MARNGTRTSTFGVGSRENHDASDFYRRFKPPVLSQESTVERSSIVDQIILGDSRKMVDLVDNCVALVVTSPPYFSGKEYEVSLGEGHVPSDYLDYLRMLADVFAESYRVLEPGGRICVNVANLGRKPYRSLSGDVTALLQDEVGFLLRGEIVWIKADGASGSCAWGSYASAANPVLRDVTERVIVASKGRFDRVPDRKSREKLGLPFENTISPDDFRAWTLDTWRIQPASAKRIGHPAPFPVELPRRLIELFTYKDDLVLDPWCGSGTHAIAAIESGRHYVGYEIDSTYADLANQRVAAALT